MVRRNYDVFVSAAALGIGLRTIATHVGAIYCKLDISIRAEATVEAIRMGVSATLRVAVPCYMHSSAASLRLAGRKNLMPTALAWCGEGHLFYLFR